MTTDEWRILFVRVSDGVLLLRGREYSPILGFKLQRAMCFSQGLLFLELGNCVLCGSNSILIALFENGVRSMITGRSAAYAKVMVLLYVSGSYGRDSL